jgi:hypothetical protein
MTYAERIEMYKEKSRFIKRLNSALTNPQPKGFTAADIRYEVYSIEVDDVDKIPHTLFQEWIIITFDGGATSSISVGGNSNAANLRVISENIHGGYYSEERTYETVSTTWKQINLNN